MSLYENWRSTAYENEQDEKEQKKFWEDYFTMEESIYEKLLSNPTEIVEGTLKDLADKFETDIMLFTGFLDGINDSLVNEMKMEELEESSNVKLEIDFEKLYYNMLAAKAEWLYSLPQWDSILAPEKRKAITKEQRLSGTVIKAVEPGRNDPCSCGSGKKYKKCCGANK
ncbi:MAG TPA: SEC-C metal-binding domain-containing protein [Clostridia bacterium]|nr:SEC-C metal-binding domain-containing protein [Clostridia bacterium]